MNDVDPRTVPIREWNRLAQENAENAIVASVFEAITLQSGIRMDRVLSEFYKPLPFWVRWLGERNLRRNAGNPQMAYIPLVKAITGQGVLALLQTLLFLAFLSTAFVFAAITAA